MAGVACLLLLAACPPPEIDMEIREANGEHHLLPFKFGRFGTRGGETPCLPRFTEAD